MTFSYILFTAACVLCWYARERRVSGSDKQSPPVVSDNPKGDVVPSDPVVILGGKQ